MLEVNNKSFQMEISGTGWILIQPSEGPLATAAASGGAGGGLGKLLSG